MFGLSINFFKKKKNKVVDPNYKDWELPDSVRGKIKKEFVEGIRKVAEKHPDATIQCMCGNCKKPLKMTEYYNNLVEGSKHTDKDLKTFVSAQKHIASLNGKTREEFIKQYE